MLAEQALRITTPAGSDLGKAYRPVQIKLNLKPLAAAHPRAGWAQPIWELNTSAIKLRLYKVS